MTFLITGALGSVASIFVNYFSVNSNNTYICVDCLKNKEDRLNLKTLYLSNVTFYEYDILNDDIEQIFLEHEIDGIINFAQVCPNLFENHNMEDYDLYNCETVVELYNLGIKYKIKHFNQISTVEVYGSSDTTIFYESSACNPNSDYAKSKLKAERFLLSKNDMIISICRLDNCCTLNMSNNKVFSNIINTVTNQTEIIINENEDIVRSYIDVLDCVFFINQISLTSSAGIFNITSNLYLSYKELVNTICEVFDYDNTKILFQSEKSAFTIKVNSDHVVETFNYLIDKQKEKLVYFLQEVKLLYSIYKDMPKIDIF